MSQAGRTRNTGDHQALRAEIIRLLRAGQPVDRAALAPQFGVTQRTVSAIRIEVETILKAAVATDGANRRTVQNFDGARLFYYRTGWGGTPGKLWLTQEHLARLAGRSRGAIGHLENGHRKPTIPTLQAIADALGVDPAELLREESSEQRHSPHRLGGDHHPAAP